MWLHCLGNLGSGKLVGGFCSILRGSPLAKLLLPYQDGLLASSTNIMSKMNIILSSENIVFLY